MAYAAKGTPEQIEKLTEFGRGLGVEELYSSPTGDIEVKTKYRLRSVEDIKKLPVSLKRKFFTQFGALRKPYKIILETLISEGAVSPHGLYIHNSDSVFTNFASHLVEIGLLERQKVKKKSGWSANLISEHRVANLEIAKALISDYRLPIWKR